MMGLYGAVPRRKPNASACSLTEPPCGSAPFAKVADANAVGVAYVPADRRKEGLLLPALDRLQSAPALVRQPQRRTPPSEREETAITERLAQRLNIRGDRRRPAQALSGGNQQKVALSKWLTLEPSVLLLNDPTRGVDVETKREIYLALRAMAAEGKAVVLLSTDTPELVHLCDRVMVFNKGRVAATLPHAEASEEAIVAAAMGVRMRRRLQGRRFDAGSGRATLLGDPVAAQRRPWRAVPGPRRVRGHSTQSCFPESSPSARWPSSSRAGSRRRWSRRRKRSSCSPAESIFPSVRWSASAPWWRRPPCRGRLGIFGGVLALLALGTGVGAIVGAFRRHWPISGDHRDARALVRLARRRASHHAAARRIRSPLACPIFSPAVIRPPPFCSCCSSSYGSSIRRRL